MKKIFKKALEHKGGMCGITTDFCNTGGIPKSLKKSRFEDHKEMKKKAEENLAIEEMKNKKDGVESEK